MDHQLKFTADVSTVYTLVSSGGDQGFGLFWKQAPRLILVS